MRKLIRSWLGLDEIEDSIDNLSVEITCLRDDLVEPLSEMATSLLTTDSEARKVLSDKLGDKAVSEMIANAQARLHTTGGPD